MQIRRVRDRRRSREEALDEWFFTGMKCVAVLGRREIWQPSRGDGSVMFKLAKLKRSQGSQT